MQFVVLYDRWGEALSDVAVIYAMQVERWYGSYVCIVHRKVFLVWRDVIWYGVIYVCNRIHCASMWRPIQSMARLCRLLM